MIVVVFVPLAVVLHVMLSRTRIGSHIYAAGNDERAAFLFAENAGSRVRGVE